MNTPVTAHVNECVKILNEHNSSHNFANTARRKSLEAVFELLDQPWEDLDPELGEWREGYETAMMDVCDAIAQEWGVTLPTFVRSQEA